MANLGFQGPGTAVATLCGAGLDAGETSTYEVTGAQPIAPGALLLSVPGLPNIPVFAGSPSEGTLVSGAGFAASIPILSDASGTVSIQLSGQAPIIELVLQCVLADGAVPESGLAFTNAVLAQTGQQ